LASIGTNRVKFPQYFNIIGPEHPERALPADDLVPQPGPKLRPFGIHQDLELAHPFGTRHQ
jgi:hypothetical protein